MVLRAQGGAWMEAARPVGAFGGRDARARRGIAFLGEARRMKVLAVQKRRRIDCRIAGTVE